MSTIKSTMKLKTLQSLLEDIDTFQNPKIKFKKYTTSSYIAAFFLHTVEHAYNAITDKYVAVLGCGSGLLCIGAALLKAKYCTGFDIDPSELALSVKNAAKHGVSNCCDFILCDIKNIENLLQPKKFDTVIMSLPIKIKKKGVDLLLLEAAFKLANNAVYSLHKSKTRSYIKNWAKQLGVHCKVVSEMYFDLPEHYKPQRKGSINVKLDLIRFSLKTPEPKIHPVVILFR